MVPITVVFCFVRYFSIRIAFFFLQAGVREVGKHFVFAVKLNTRYDLMINVVSVLRNHAI